MLTVGLIGAGRIGRVHASTISMHAHSKLVAVADVIEDNAQKLARDFGGQACTVDAIYKDKSIDAVLVASSTDTHSEIIEKATLAGKAVLCEKPVDTVSYTHLRAHET